MSDSSPDTAATTAPTSDTVSEPEDAATPPSLPDIDVLCDGSDRIRFSSTFGGQGGPVAFYNAFLSSNFLVIDGTCRYWVNDPSLRGLRSGLLSSDEAELLAQSLHYGRYEAMSAAYDSVQCPDGGGWTLTDSTHNLVCRCGNCNFGTEPEEFQEAFATAGDLHNELGSREEWAWGPTSILPVSSGENNLSLTWTLDLDLAEVALDGGLEQNFASDAGVQIDDADQLALLSALREQSLARGETSQLLVEDADGNHYTLFVRDEPPAAVIEALSAEAHD